MKTLFLKIALALVFLAAFNILFFLLCWPYINTAVWISYGFIHASYLFLLITPFLTVRTETAPVLNYTIWSQTITYFIAELLVGTGFIIYAVNAPSNNTAWPLAVQGIILAVFLIILIGNMLANEATQRHEEEKLAETHNFRDMVDELRALAMEEVDADTQAAVQKCYDELRYGPVGSHPSVTNIENHIMNCIGILQDAIAEGNAENSIRTAKELLRKIQLRNRKLKYIH